MNTIARSFPFYRRPLIFTFLVLLLSTLQFASAQLWPVQEINPPIAFDDATQWGIGTASIPDQSAGIVVGFNYSNGQAFAQFYQTDPATGNWTAFGDPMFGDILTGFDTTEMNPAGALISTDTLTAIWSVSTINDSNISYGYVYIYQRPDKTQSFQLARRLTDPQIGIVNRLYGGALTGIADASLFVVGAPVYPVSADNTNPSNVEIWIRADNGSYYNEQTIGRVETKIGLFGYSLAISQDKRWLAVGAWANHSLYIFYDRMNSYNATTSLAPFGNVTRFSYSMVFSPDVEWLVVGVFQYPSPGFVGAVLVYRFNESMDNWDVANGYFLSTGAPFGDGSPGQGASVGISSVNFVNSRPLWTLAYGMPYYQNKGAVSVWIFDSLIGNWTEILPPLMANYSSDSDTFYDMGWSATAANMVSYDGCNIMVAGIGNVGVIVGTVFQWYNATGLCVTSTPSQNPMGPPSPPSPPSAPTTPINNNINPHLLILPFYIGVFVLIVVWVSYAIAKFHVKRA